MTAVISPLTARIDMARIDSGPIVADERRAAWDVVARVQAGDAQAFGELYDRYVTVVYRFVLARVRDQYLAEDLTSDTFLRALKAIGSLTYLGQDPGAWLMTIARNLVFDHYKSARARLEAPSEVIDIVHETAHSAEYLVVQQASRREVMAAVAQLGDAQKECVILRFILQLSVEETAQIMDKPHGAIKSLQHRAMRSLLAILGTERDLAA